MEVALPARHVSISLPLEEMSGVGEARRRAIRLAESLQFSESDVGRVALVVTEAATNIIQHAKRGEILLRAIVLEAPPGLEVLALDQGAGIANVAQALRDGFSTGGSAGLGLGSIARLSTCFEISSTRGKGTALLARIGRSAPGRHHTARGPHLEPRSQSDAAGLEWGVVCVPQRGEEVCGDAWTVRTGQDKSTLLVVDGLGHGLLAFEAAQQALRAFWGRASTGPAPQLRAVHDALCDSRATRETRGVVAAIAEIAWQPRELRYSGAGNIAATLVAPAGAAHSLLSHSGTLGESVTRFEELVYPWPKAGVLVLHSDGLSNHWELDHYPGLTCKHPSLIAGVLYRDFANRRDDVVVVVVRERATSPAGAST